MYWHSLHCFLLLSRFHSQAGRAGRGVFDPSYGFLLNPLPALVHCALITTLFDYSIIPVFLATSIGE